MQAFRFTLEKALNWRQTQQDAEELKLKELKTALTQVNAALARIRAIRLATELEAKGLESLTGRDLAALATFRVRMANEEQKLICACAASRDRFNEQQLRWAEAKRRCKLLEKLKDRQRAEFTTEMDRQAERLATDLYLAQWGT